MTNDEVRRALVGHLETNWATYTPMARENWPFDPGSWSASQATWTRVDGWIQPFLIPGGSFPGEIRGVGVKVGVFMVEINITLNKGTKIGWDLADKVESLYRNQDLSGVQVGIPHTTKLGENGGYYRFITTIPFECFVGE